MRKIDIAIEKDYAFAMLLDDKDEIKVRLENTDGNGISALRQLSKILRLNYQLLQKEDMKKEVMYWILLFLHDLAKKFRRDPLDDMKISCEIILDHSSRIWKSHIYVNDKRIESEERMNVMNKDHAVEQLKLLYDIANNHKFANVETVLPEALRYLIHIIHTVGL